MLSILNTRPKHQATNLTQQIQRLGGTVFHLPLMQIEPIVFSPVKLTNVDYVIWTSANAVACFFKGRPTIIDTFSCTVIAIGSATKAALAHHITTIPLCPSQFSSEGILSMPELQQINNKKIVIISGENPKSLLNNALQKRGAIVETIFCYQRKKIEYDLSTLFPEILRANINVIVCTSGDNFSHLIHLFQQPDHKNWLLSKTLCVVNAAMKQNALALGFQSILQAENATDESILAAIAYGAFRDGVHTITTK